MAIVESPIRRNRIRKLKRRISYWTIRIVQSIRITAYRIFNSAKVIGSPKLLQPTIFAGLGTISFEGRVVLGYFPSPFYLSTYAHIEARRSTATISIGDGTFINNNFCAIAEHSSITIGRNCRIGCNVEILDSDFHGLDPELRSVSLPEWARPVAIADNVFIGSNVKILKGVSIGSGSVIANGTILTRSVPSNSIYGGNPGRMLRTLDSKL
jgi:acetyltransferase-like isoleucine patch superfamily enzyme